MPNNKKTVKVVQMKKFNFIKQMVMELCTIAYNFSVFVCFPYHSTDYTNIHTK